MNHRNLESLLLNRVKWTTDMEIAFIMLVEKKPQLWDTRHEHFLKKRLKFYSFKEISASLQDRWPEAIRLFTHEGLVNKFANLKSYYRKECKKLKEKRLNSGAFQSKWEHFTRLSFLDQVNEISESNLVSSSPLEFCEVSMPSEVILPDAELDSTDQNRDTSALKLTISRVSGSNAEEDCSNRTKFKRRRSSDESRCDSPVPTTSQKTNPGLQSSSEAVNASSSQGKRDTSAGDSQDAAFCHYLLSELSNIPDCAEKERAKIRILETILELKYPHG